jgi:hypothetical protein
MIEDVLAIRRRFSAMGGQIGFVLGPLTADGRVDRESLCRFVDAADGCPVTFHKAFDAICDLSESLAILKKSGVQRVLTSGGQRLLTDGETTLQELVLQVAGDVVVLAAGQGAPATSAASCSGPEWSTTTSSRRDRRRVSVTGRIQNWTLIQVGDPRPVSISFAIIWLSSDSADRKPLGMPVSRTIDRRSRIVADSVAVSGAESSRLSRPTERSMRGLLSSRWVSLNRSVTGTDERASRDPDRRSRTRLPNAHVAIRCLQPFWSTIRRLCRPRISPKRTPRVYPPLSVGGMVI